MIYLDVIFGLNFAVDLLLLAAANRITGYPCGLARCAAGAALGGIYGAACLLPGMGFLGGGFWRIVFLAVMGLIAYGFDRSAVRRIGVFILLSMALGGAASAMENNNGLTLVLCLGILGLICAVGFPRGKTGRQYAALTLCHGGKSLEVTALLDTGNTLLDPATGRQVIVVGPQIALELLGLTQEQLSSPVQTVALGKIPGLRLIPYRAVGTASAMLLGIRLEEVRMGKERKDVVVAFAPNSLGNEGYQALAGGTI